MYKLRGWAFVPLVVSPTSSEDVSDVEELRLARVVVDAVVVVADVDVAVVHASTAAHEEVRALAQKPSPRVRWRPDCAEQLDRRTQLDE